MSFSKWFRKEQFASIERNSSVRRSDPPYYSYIRRVHSLQTALISHNRNKIGGRTYACRTTSKCTYYNMLRIKFR